VIGAAGILRRAIRLLGADLAVRSIEEPSASRFAPGTIDLVPAGEVTGDLPFGKVSAAAGRAAYACIERAIAEARAGALRAIVTAPISKEALNKAGIDFPDRRQGLRHAAC
jgi:4-hydroxythreonine-4-phosphate dehydrogenase